MKKNLIVAAVLALAGASAFAQTAASTTQRDVNQQNRVEQGLQNGSITTREGALLERDQQHVDQLQAKDLKNGSLSNGERAQLRAAQNKSSRDITKAEGNGVNGNPLSASSQRLQADVQRNANQQQRTENGIKNGSLTNHEVSKVERGQAKVDHAEFASARDGHVGAGEQSRIQHRDNAQSKRIYRQKHDAQTRG